MKDFFGFLGLLSVFLFGLDFYFSVFSIDWTHFIGTLLPWSLTLGKIVTCVLGACSFGVAYLWLWKHFTGK